jgi:SAM-dependent methyltransferase/CTP:molybdopterin cytidylyltransferase MocA
MTLCRRIDIETRALCKPMHESPKTSVVVNTYNRAAQVGKAIESVLSQSGVDLELVVVDDGSTDDTQAVIAALADVRMRCVRRSNRGLSASRNVGAREARGDWLLFLDDDDRLCESALQALLTAATDPSCRVVVGGVRFIDSDGRTLQERAPVSLDHALAGTFLISRTLFHEAGGYLEGMPCSHQTELFLRVRQVLGDRVGAISFVARPVVEVERRPAAGRPQRSPANAYFGGRWLAARHPDQYTTRQARATIETIAAVNAMRIGREADARRRFASAVRHDPLSPGRYLRLGGAIVAPIGRRIWLRQWDTAPGVQRPLDRVRRTADCNDPTAMLPLERDPSPGPDSLFLPWRYRENSLKSANDEGSPCWQEGLAGDLRDQAPIYKLAARLARTKGLVPVIDIGCGSGHNLVRYVGRVTNDFVGFDEPNGISIARQSFPNRTWVADDLDDEPFWDDVSCLKPQLVLCSDLVERVPDPRRLLSGIRHAVSDGGLALISTSDRSRLQPEATMGPPSNPRHIREWCAEEFSLLLESCGFEILRRVHRLPRAYSPTLPHVNGLVWRVPHRQPVPDRRSSMGFLVQAARDDRTAVATGQATSPPRSR